MRRICWLLLVLLPACRAFGDDQWVEVKSPHFQLITDGGAQRGREILQRFEEMRTGFGVLFKKMNVNISVPLEIVAFKNSKEIRRYSPMYNGKPVELAGVYFQGEDRNFIVIDLSEPFENWAVVFHEYAHLLLNSNMPSLPAWFDEGYAEYCSSLTVEDKKVKLGLAVPHDVQQLQNERWMPISDLFSITHDSHDYNEGNRRSVFYAESWLMVHYLVGTDQIKKANEYLRLTRAGRLPAGEAIQRAFGMDSAALEKALHKYLEGGHAVYFSAPAPAGIEHTEAEVRAISALEAQVTLADLHYHARYHQSEGLAEFEQILKQEPDNALANRSLGYAYLRAGNYARASESFQRASAKDPSDPRLHYFTALLLTREASNTGEVSTTQFVLSKTDASRLGKIISETQRALQLDPGYADAWGLLGYAQSVQGNMKDAIVSTQHALELAPRNESYRINLANVYLQTSQFAEAGELLTPLAAADNVVIAAHARQMLQFIERAHDSENQRRPAEAENVPQNATVNPISSSSLQRRVAAAPEPQPEPEAQPAAPAPIGYAKGKITKTECSDQSADLTLQSGARLLHLHVRNVESVALIGTEKFSCDWRNQPAAVNYRILGNDNLSVISIELP